MGKQLLLLTEEGESDEATVQKGTFKRGEVCLDPETAPGNGGGTPEGPYDVRSYVSGSAYILVCVWQGYVDRGGTRLPGGGMLVLGDSYRGGAQASVERWWADVDAPGAVAVLKEFGAEV